MDAVKLLLGAGAAVNHPGWTPLMYAATGGQDAVIEYLLAEGAQLNAVSPNGTSALMMAIREGKVSSAILLIKKAPTPTCATRTAQQRLDGRCATTSRGSPPRCVARARKNSGQGVASAGSRA